MRSPEAILYDSLETNDMKLITILILTGLHLYTGSPVRSERKENSMVRVPRSERILAPSGVQGKPLAAPVFMLTRDQGIPVAVLNAGNSLTRWVLTFGSQFPALVWQEIKEKNARVSYTGSPHIPVCYL